MAKVSTTLNRRAFLQRFSQMFGLIAYLRMSGLTTTKVQTSESHPITQKSDVEQGPLQAYPYGTGLYGQELYPAYHVMLPLVSKE